MRVSAKIMDTNIAAKTNAPAAEQIALRAYELWERQGRPEGHAFDHWVQAEMELKAASAQQTPATLKEAVAEVLRDEERLRAPRARRVHAPPKPACH